MDPARMFKESLTSRPELENSLGPKRNSAAPGGDAASTVLSRICRRLRKLGSHVDIDQPSGPEHEQNTFGGLIRRGRFT
jgi:hypothetical protein